MKTEKLDLGHKDLLWGRFKALGLPVSEYSFANLYLFRKEHDYEVHHFENSVFITGITYDGKRYVMPTEKIGVDVINKIIHLLSDADFIFPIPEEWLVCFDTNVFRHDCHEEDSDYLYLASKLGNYPGKKLHGKRNLMKQFSANYRHEEYPLTQDRLGDAVIILKEWQKESGLPSEKTDFMSCLEAIELYEQLVICGGIYYAENAPAGFIIGEELNQETFALHFAKAAIRFKGIYQYIFNNFANILPAKYTYINLEQDMGNENLRKSKTSYMPDLMLRKYRLSLK